VERIYWRRCNKFTNSNIVCNIRNIQYSIGFSVAQWPEIVELQTEDLPSYLPPSTQKEEDCCGSKAQSIEDSFFFVGSSPIQRERASTVGVYKASLRRNEIAPDGMCLYICVLCTYTYTCLIRI
jgi:hypothetical protein